MTLLFFLLCCTLSPAIAQHDLKTLLKKQSSDPTNPLTNYNLGVAQYKKSMYQDAANNFSRAHNQETANVTLKKHALFNAAKSHEQYGLHLLPENWQQPKVRVENTVLEKAIKALENAISWYKKDTAPDKKIIKNKEKANQLLEQLRKKLEQQKQQQEQKKQQEQDDKNKDNEDKSDTQKNQGGQDQSQDKQSDSQQQSGDKSQKPEQGENQKSKQKNNEKQSEGSGKEQEVDKDTQHGDQDKKQDNGKDQTKESSDPGEKGDKDEPKGQQPNADKQQEDEKSNHKPSPDKKELNANQEASSEGTPSANKKQEPMQTRRMQAMLENLDADESKKQKSLLLQQLNTNQAPPQQGQKPW